ncbi:MAG: prepilin-type N-terminal cleavage/methylation domain-containing protein [Campylobacterales bacterium]|nr:prepilin-type N-terminal cleavage/methylation domain-containing protein [Campylobacterales bacterium]
MKLKKKAFTLFELLIVIFIISLVYALFIQNLNTKPQTDTLTIEKLRDFLLANYYDKNKVSVICFEESKKCKVFINDKDTKDEFILFDEDVNVYYLNKNVLEKKRFFDFHVTNYDKEKVSFKFDLYPNKSSSEFILEYKQKYYLFDSYMHSTKVFDYIDDAKEYWIEQRLKAKGTQI